MNEDVRPAPSMANTNNMIDITQTELQQLVGNDTRCIAEAEQAVVGKDGVQRHRSGMEDALMA